MMFTLLHNLVITGRNPLPPMDSKEATGFEATHIPMLAGGRNRGPNIRSIVCFYANVNTYTLKSRGCGFECTHVFG